MARFKDLIEPMILGNMRTKPAHDVRTQHGHHRQVQGRLRRHGHPISPPQCGEVRLGARLPQIGGLASERRVDRRGAVAAAETTKSWPFEATAKGRTGGLNIDPDTGASQMPIFNPVEKRIVSHQGASVGLPAAAGGLPRCQPDAPRQRRRTPCSAGTHSRPSRRASTSFRRGGTGSRNCPSPGTDSANKQSASAWSRSRR